MSILTQQAESVSHFYAQKTSRPRVLSDALPVDRRSTLMPFWFWNDRLNHDTLRSQIEMFESSGVYGFVIHPRVGLPRELGWMSPELLDYVRFAVEEAATRDMRVILYDEGMYPSGSSCGQVVAASPALACRCLALSRNDTSEQSLFAFERQGEMFHVIDRPVDACIRGLHYIEDGPHEDEPAMADILNPASTAKFIELVYEKYFHVLQEYFGSTVIGMFTDEPNTLGRCREEGVYPGTTGILEHLNRLLGYDFQPHLPKLWFDDWADVHRYRRDYLWAINRRLEETWYAPLSHWCQSHDIALCGHPAEGDQIGVQKYFHVPGQDLVWRVVAMDQPSALQGAESTQAKCSSSAMIHRQLTRNSNEFAGAYGHETTHEEVKWLADWCLVRGVNMLIPHAFYYSVRGHRRDERPPQLGIHSPWWQEFKPFADHCARLSDLNTNSTHVCDVAILTDPDHCPWHAAEVLFQNQIDFNYLELDFLEQAEVTDAGVMVAGMQYRAVIDDGLGRRTPDQKVRMDELAKQGRLIHGVDLRALRQLCRPDVQVDPAYSGLRVRHVIKHEAHWYMFHNECVEPIDTPLALPCMGDASWIDTATGLPTPAATPLQLQLDGHALKLLRIVLGD